MGKHRELAVRLVGGKSMLRNVIKRISIIILVVILSNITFASIVSDDDGSAFITKADFESMKDNFNEQIDKYNASIDNKIDGAIASYLAGINVAKKGETSNLQSGIIWSIGPFDRPRYKHGIPIWDMFSGRTFFPLETVAGADINRATHIMLRSSWGADFTNKTPIVNRNWAYKDVLLKNISNEGALFDGWYDLCGHWKQIWMTNNLQNRWYDVEENMANSTYMVPYLSSQGHNAATEFWSGNFRPVGLDASDNYVHMSGNPHLAFSTGDGNVNYSSITKGDQMLWNNNVSVFGPISYKCFNEEHNNRPAPYDPQISAYYLRDEINYITLSSAQLAGNSYTVRNFLYRVLPDRSNYADNPWNKTSLTSPISDIQYALHIYHSDTDNILYDTTQPLDMTKSLYLIFSLYDPSNPNVHRFFQHVYIQEPGFVTDIQNWNKVGLEINKDVLNYLKDNSLTSQLLTLDNDSKALSLAAGVPISLLEKRKKVTIKGEFRKDCEYTYNATTKTNTLNEGTLDNSNAYVIYAKYTPFNINGMPEDESDLIDISTADTDNKGKLTKCRIVRNGKINIEFENDDNKDKVIFLKWEKLSNWNSARTTRRTGTATNTDVHKLGTLTGETITAPTWTYFGGGYIKFDDKFEWEDI